MLLFLFVLLLFVCLFVCFLYFFRDGNMISKGTVEFIYCVVIILLVNLGKGT